jgi:hypothetical protein
MKTAQKLPIGLVLRDLAILMVTALGWWADTMLRDRGGGLAMTVAVTVGVLTALCGFLAHEWGHLAGSVLSGSVVHYPPRLLTPLLFHFDSAKNDRRKFFWMSAAGYLATVLVVALIVWFVPHQAWSGRIALALAGIGALVTFVLEVPITVRVARGAPHPLGVAYRPFDEPGPGQ